MTLRTCELEWVEEYWMRKDEVLRMKEDGREERYGYRREDEVRRTKVK